MRRARPWTIAAAGALASLTAVLAGAAFLALSRPGELKIGALSVGLAGGLDNRALRRIERSSAPADLDQATSDINRALSLSPYNNSARLRLTYIDVLRHGALRTQGVAQLSKSYDLVPYDHTVAAWRVRFALEHWGELSPSEREAVRAEAMAFAKVSSQDANMRRTLKEIRNPNGRLAAALWLRALNR